MSSHVNSLKKQIEQLQDEVERYANAVDRLAAELVEKEAQLSAAMAPVENDTAEMTSFREAEHEAGNMA